MIRTLLVLACALVPIPSDADSGTTTPLVQVPVDRWGSLEPAAIIADSTHVIFEPGSNPYPFDLEIQGDYLFIAAGTGIRVDDISNPAAPVNKTSFGGGPEMIRRGLYWALSDKDYYITSVDAPPGNDDLFVTDADDFGLIVWDSRKKNAVNWHYQDAGPQGHFVTQVYAARLPDGREYAFGVTTAGLALYDLTSAATKTKCRENVALGETGCGVFEGLLSGVGTVSGIDEYIAARVGTAGVNIYRVASGQGFANLTPRIQGTLPGTFNSDVAMWKYDYDGDGSDEYYLAALSSFSGLPPTFVQSTFLYFYDVTCATVGACALPSPLLAAGYDVTDHSNDLARQTTLTISYDGPRPYLYVGNENVSFPDAPGVKCLAQREYPLDLSLFSPGNPPPLATMDLTPSGEVYWGWYYRECHVDGQSGGPGFNKVRPIRAKVAKGHLFRAGYSFSDVHRIVGDSTDPTDLISEDGFESGDLSAWSGPRGGVL